MLYAAYGSNLHPVRLTARTPSATLIGTASCSGWRLGFSKRSVDGSGKCTLLEDSASHVNVAIYEIETQDVSALDAIEGVGRGYEVSVLDIAGFGRCRTYVASEDFVDRSLTPYSWYQALVLVGCEWLGFPHAYTRWVREHRSVEDDDRMRHNSHMSIVAEASRLPGKASRAALDRSEL